MARILPPFAALRAFEAAARHCSFKQASEELNLSPSAVSHQIRSLEDYLGVCLFHRKGSTLELTELAHAYRDEVAKALNILEVASSRVEMARDEASLVVNLFPSLVSTWLLPRLAQFKLTHEDINIHIVSSFEPIHFTGSDIDLAIRCSADSPQDAESAFLFEEEIVPVCSPAYRDELGTIKDPKALLRGTMICCASHTTEWDDWFQACGTQLCRAEHKVESATIHSILRLEDIGGRGPANCIELETRAMVLDAARNGLGLAMARKPFADDMIRKGELVTPFDMKIKSGMNYYLCWPERKARFPNVVNFREWLLSTIKSPPAIQPQVLPERLSA